MSIVYQHDKRSGITYAYESKSYWDKEKKQSRAKRTLLGRVDGETGEIVPTDGRGKRPKALGKDPDYKALYRATLARCKEQEAEIASLRALIAEAQG